MGMEVYKYELAKQYQAIKDEKDRLPARSRLMIGIYLIEFPHVDEDTICPCDSFAKDANSTLNV